MLVPIDSLLRKELYGDNASTDSYIKPRLKQIYRSRNDFFFSDARAKGSEVDCFDRFQDRYDFQNEIRSMLIKPLVALNLAAKYEIDADTTFLFFLIDFITGADDETVTNTLLRGLSDLFYSGYYVVYAVALLLDSTIEISVRSSISLVEGLCESIYDLCSENLAMPQCLPKMF